MPRKQPKREVKNKKPKATAPKPTLVKKRTVKKKKAVTRKTKPSYLRMIANAISAVQEETSKRKAVSYVAICRYLEETYPVPEKFKRFVLNAIKLAVEDGLLAQTKLSYRATPKLKAQLAPKKKKKRASTKKKTAKRTKKPAAKKAKKSTGKKRKAPAKRTAKRASPKKKRKTTPKKASKRSNGSREVESEDEGELRWVWQYEDNGFYNYDLTASEMIEDMYQTYKKTPSACDVHAVDSGQWQYMIDFRQWTQMNKQHESHTVRNIRRKQVSAKDYVYPSRKFT